MMDKIYFIITMIIAFYISVNSIQNFTIKFEAIDSVVDEYKSGMIEDLIVLGSEESSCPDDYQSLVHDFNWPGNEKGCGCKNDESEKSYQFYRNYCPIMKVCHSVEETSEINFTKWRGRLICYKRAEREYKKLLLIEFDNIEICKNQTHHICGAVDGKNNVLCLSKNETCPITEIRFVKKEEIFKVLDSQANDNSTVVLNNTISNSKNLEREVLPQYNKTTSRLQKINDDIYLYTSKEDLEIGYTNNNLNSDPALNSKVFSFFRIDLTTPCLNAMRSPSSENFFPLMKNKFDLMCDRNENGTEMIDDSFISIDSYKFEDYYKDNNYYHSLRKLIDPFKIEIPKYLINIYARGYLGWSLKCRSYNPESLNSFLEISKELNGMLLSVIIHSFISLALIIVIGVFACFLSKYFELLFKAVNLGFIILNLIYPLQVISNSNWVINNLTDENGALCGDNKLNLLLVEISSACLSLQYSFILILLLAILSCVVFIYILYAWITPATREVQETLIEMKY